MEENRMEMMENETFDEAEVVETESGGKGGALVIGLALAAGAVGATVVKKIKDKKAAKKPKKKRRLMWVEVEDEVETEVAENEETEKED